MSNLTHGLATQLFKNKTFADDEILDIKANPFKVKNTMQQLLIQREKESYQKAAKKEMQA